MNKIPPPVLVSTWISLVGHTDSQEVRARASSMLLGAFESINDLVTYCETHAIDLAPCLKELRVSAYRPKISARLACGEN